MNDKELLALKQEQAHKRIAKLRGRIDGCDEQIVRLLAKRFTWIRKIGKIKRKAKLPVQDSGRESLLFSRLACLAKKFFVPLEHIIAPFRTIIFFSKLSQRRGKSVEDNKPIVPKFCPSCNWKTCGIGVKDSSVRVCPACYSPLY